MSTIAVIIVDYHNAQLSFPFTYYGFPVEATGTLDCDTSNIDIIAHCFVLLILRTTY
jgi:hypothetical protein